MPDKTPDKILLSIIKKYPHGISIEAIQAALPQPMAKRTLQRHLSALVEANKIRRLGKGPAVIYLPPPQSSDETKSASTININYSKEAKRLKQHLQKPLSARKKANYQRDFLYEYQPNITYYLPQTLRSHLKRLGKQENGQKPSGTFARTILKRLLIDLSWNSSRLEGNTYSLLETQRLLFFGKRIHRAI